MNAKTILFGALLSICLNVDAQDNEGNSKWELNGYLKGMQSIYIIDGFDSLLTDNLIHNRINLAWYPVEHVKTVIEFRNRIFYGDFVRLIPNFGELPDDNNDYFDLSFNIIDANNLVFNTTIDRFYFEYNKNDWEVRFGRQRINWGVNIAWNPNDIFNAYSFFDFDYEERPGSDALRIKKYTGIASSVEIAANLAENSRDWTIGGMWKTNFKNYDIQFLAGKAKTDIVIGTGWAGNLGTAGFKGEVSYYKPLDKYAEETFETVMISATWDYSFANSLYLNGSFLINTGIDPEEAANFFGFLGRQRLDSKSVLPYKYATFLQANYPVTPLINAGLSWMTFPGERAYFVNPVVTISVFENFDFDIIGQLFHDSKAYGGTTNSNALFLRLKYSF